MLCFGNERLGWHKHKYRPSVLLNVHMTPDDLDEEIKTTLKSLQEKDASSDDSKKSADSKNYKNDEYHEYEVNDDLDADDSQW